MTAGKINWYKYAAPANFYPLAGKIIPWFAVVTALLFVVGLYVGFFVAPTDSSTYPRPGWECFCMS